MTPILSLCTFAVNTKNSKANENGVSQTVQANKTQASVKQHITSRNNWISQQEYVTETAIQQNKLQKLHYFLEQK